MDIRIEKSKGYAGNRGMPSYVASIIGTDTHYGFSRVFCRPAEVEWPDGFAWARKARATRTDVYRVGPGMYEVVQDGVRSYRIVWQDGGAEKTRTVDVDRAMDIARLMDTGEDYERARRATRPAPQALQVTP